MTYPDKPGAVSGRRIKENGEVVNQADMIEAIYNALVVNKNAGMLLTGSNLTDEEAIPTKEVERTFIAPVGTEYRATQTIQTHNGATIAPNSWNTGSWIDSWVEGSPLTYLGITASMISGTGMTITVHYSHDNSNKIGESIVNDSALAEWGTDKDIQLPSRYFRISAKNKDASVPKNTNILAYLKA